MVKIEKSMMVRTDEVIKAPVPTAYFYEKVIELVLRELTKGVVVETKKTLDLDYKLTAKAYLVSIELGDEILNYILSQAFDGDKKALEILRDIKELEEKINHVKQSKWLLGDNQKIEKL